MRRPTRTAGRAWLLVEYCVRGRTVNIAVHRIPRIVNVDFDVFASAEANATAAAGAARTATAVTATAVVVIIVGTVAGVRRRGIVVGIVVQLLCSC